jgi:trehalose-phosphatase
MSVSSFHGKVSIGKMSLFPFVSCYRFPSASRLQMMKDRCFHEEMLSRFFERLQNASHRALLCDYDGTLAPFTVKRDEARPYRGIPEVLTAILDRGHTRLVLISGRALKDLIPLLGMERLPEIWGSHGGERLRPDGKSDAPTISGELARELKRVAQWIASRGWEPALEKKPMGLALHWRGLPDSRIRQMQTAIAHYGKERLNQKLLALHAFDGGMEFRPCGISKADAVRTLLQEMPPGTVTAYLGDDRTDEDAFRALKEKGLGILVRPEMRPTRADVWLRPPDELLGFLWRWHELTA